MVGLALPQVKYIFHSSYLFFATWAWPNLTLQHDAPKFILDLTDKIKLRLISSYNYHKTMPWLLS